MKTKILFCCILTMMSVHTYASGSDDDYISAVELLYGEGAKYPEERVHKSNTDMDALPYLDATQKHGLNLEKIFEDYRSTKKKFPILMVDYILYYHEYNQLHFRSPMKYKIERLLILCKNEILESTPLTAGQLEYAARDKESEVFKKSYYKKISEQKNAEKRKALKQNGSLNSLLNEIL